MGNVVPILIGRGLEKGHSCVDKTNYGVNVFTSMILDLQVPNLEEQEVQCGLRAILETTENQIEHKRSCLTFNRSTQMFFIASVPEVTVHIGLEGHFEECHVLLNIWLINPSLQIL